MKKLLAISAIAGALFAAGVADANAGSRSGSISGPRGTTTFSGSRSCAGGVCSSQGSVTGPYGGTISHQGSSTCSGGTCSSSGSSPAREAARSPTTGQSHANEAPRLVEVTAVASRWHCSRIWSWINSQACSISTPA